MQIVSSCSGAQHFVRDAQRSGKRVGFVPTMGALHQGHLSLIDLAHDSCDVVVASIFVNPTQFGPNEDLAKYPRPMDSDLAKLRERGVQMVFAPSSEEMYPKGYSTTVSAPDIAIGLEGPYRPGHFEGVTTIVTKLFHAVPADLAVFGQKDYQQWKVIEAMVRDLNLGIELVAGPIIREPDGLAMSSRNAFLSEQDRERSLVISRALDGVQTSIQDGERVTAVLESLMHTTLNHAHGPDARRVDARGVDAIDYAVIVDANHLNPIETVHKSCVALIAAHVGGTRLIDNLQLKIS